MKKKAKKVVVAAVMCGCLGGSIIPVHANVGTVEFDVTSPNDPKSKRSQKKDDEQAFYVTGETFNMDKIPLECRSYGVYDDYIYSNPVYISTSNRSDYEVYTGSYAPAGTWCFMETRSSVSGYRVTGRYTP